MVWLVDWYLRRLGRDTMRLARSILTTHTSNQQPQHTSNSRCSSISSSSSSSRRPRLPPPPPRPPSCSRRARLLPLPLLLVGGVFSRMCKHTIHNHTHSHTPITQTPYRSPRPPERLRERLRDPPPPRRRLLLLLLAPPPPSLDREREGERSPPRRPLLLLRVFVVVVGGVCMRCGG